MRDLKHLIYFENLLENADNELVKQAQADGKLAVGYTCYHVPEALLNVGNCFSVRLRAPRTGSLDIATYYMSNYTCEFARALVERGMEGGFQFLDALAGVDACSMMNRAMEHFEILQLNSKPNFFVSHCDIPYKITDYTLDSYVSQMRIHVLDELKNRYGVDTSDDAIRAAVAQHNEVCRIISEIGEMRKADNPVITGYEFHVLNLVTYTCPKDLILPYLRETLEELKADTRKQLTDDREAAAQRAFEDALMQKVADGIQADIPDEMVDVQAQQMMENFQQQLAAQGIPFDQYLKMTNTTEDDFKKQAHDPAVQQVRMDLAVAALVKAENLEATAQEIEDELKTVADKYGMDLDTIKKYLPEADVREQVLRSKAIKAVADAAVAVAPVVEESQEEAKQEEEKKDAE